MITRWMILDYQIIAYLDDAKSLSTLAVVLMVGFQRVQDVLRVGIRLLLFNSA